MFFFQHADLSNSKKAISGTSSMSINKSRGQNLHETGDSRGTDQNAGIYPQLMLFCVLDFCRGSFLTPVDITKINIIIQHIFCPARTMKNMEVKWRPRSSRAKGREKGKMTRW